MVKYTLLVFKLSALAFLPLGSAQTLCCFQADECDKHHRDSCKTFPELLADAATILGESVLQLISEPALQLLCGGGTLDLPIALDLFGTGPSTQVTHDDFLNLVSGINNGQSIPTSLVCPADMFQDDDPACCFNEASGDCLRRDDVESCIILKQHKAFYGLQESVAELEDTCRTGSVAELNSVFVNTNDPMITSGIVCTRGQIEDETTKGFVGGDPHIMMWGGSWFDFHGECDLVFLKGSLAGKAFDIHIRTKIRYDYSYIESAALRLDDDTLEVASWGSYFLNGVSSADLSTNATLSGYPIHYEQTSTKEVVFSIHLDNGQTITLKAFKDMVSVKLDMLSSDLKTSQGLLGEYGTNTMLARDQLSILADPIAFGQEWRVTTTDPQLFQVSPQNPQAKCLMPDPAAKSARRRLGETVAKDAAERACAHWGDIKKLCIVDVLKTGDIDYAQAGPYL